MSDKRTSSVATETAPQLATTTTTTTTTTTNNSNSCCNDNISELKNEHINTGGAFHIEKRVVNKNNKNN